MLPYAKAYVFAVWPRIPLKKGKSAKQAMKEKGLYEEYRVKSRYNPMAKFNPRLAAQTTVPLAYYDPLVGTLSLKPSLH